MARDRRVLPHNLDAEASILGGVLLRNEVLDQLDTLEVDDFYDRATRSCSQAIRNLEATAKPIDVVTLENEIEKQGKLDAIGGIAVPRRARAARADRRQRRRTTPRSSRTSTRPAS